MTEKDFFTRIEPVEFGNEVQIHDGQIYRNKMCWFVDLKCKSGLQKQDGIKHLCFSKKYGSDDFPFGDSYFTLDNTFSEITTGNKTAGF